MLNKLKGIETLKARRIKTIYLSGPITNATTEEKSIFYRVENLLRDEFYVINPLNPPDPPVYGPRAVCMKRDISYLLNDADAIILLPGWRNSSGANTEVMVAWQLDLFVYELIGNSLIEFNPALDKLPYQEFITVNSGEVV